MNIEVKEIPVNAEKMKAEIDMMDNGKVYIVQDGKMLMLPLPAFGTLEMKCQNFKVGNVAYGATVKINA